MFHPAYKTSLEFPKRILTYKEFITINYQMKNFKLIVGIFVSLSFPIEAQNTIENGSVPVTDPAEVFNNPPESAKPGVLWMWMGSNISREGITKDLETLKSAGFNRTTMFHLADITTSLSAEIGNRPGPEIISRTKPWWEMVRFAAQESKRLGMDFGMFNCPGYETSGGPWITPELSMQDICWSEQVVKGNSKIRLTLRRPEVNPRANHPFPAYNRETGQEEIPVIPARKTYYKDIAVLAVPSSGIITKNSIINLTGKMQPGGELEWDVPEGEWNIYRFGHTTTGAIIFPAQWQAAGLECDKMNQEAVNFHLDYIISEIQKYLGGLVGSGFTHVHFDSYEAGMPTWTPKMQEEFLNRRGYDLTPYLVTFAGKRIGSAKDSLKFRNDFDATIKDLYRDVYFATISKKMAAANLIFLSEPYGGPWRNDEVMPYVHNVMTEFFTDNGVFSPFEFTPTVAALRKAGKNLIETEAFTGRPAYSMWKETPAWIKPIGDAAYCEGSNRFIIHRFAHQPWDDQYKPGATMGQWGSHFDRTQTWWEPGKALVKYWQRCQALLQWGLISQTEDDFNIASSDTSLKVKHIHRSMGTTDIYFVANTSHNTGSAICSFSISGMQPELWDPVAGTMRNLPAFEDSGKKISIPLKFDDAQSFFIVFRTKTQKNDQEGKANFPLSEEILKIQGPWRVSFDPAWGGPAEPVTFTSLVDWTQRPEPGIKYYSGTVTYRTEFDIQGKIPGRQSVVYFNLGVVKHIARVKLNGRDLGVVWTAPWSVMLPPTLLSKKGNKLEIEITNVWANRLIGDEQEPPDAEWSPGYSGFKSGSWMKEFPEWFVKKQPRPSKNRYCFTTWNYFTKDSSLVSSGLLGPVTLKEENTAGMNEGSLTLSSPLDYQVFQRFAKERGTISIEGIVDGGTPEAIEVKIEGAGEAGQWKQIPATIDGSSFHAVKTIPAGGWYKVEVRAVNGKKVIAGYAVKHVGVGEVFVVAGQSNSANHGEERQKTKTGLVSVFNGNGWQLANDPQPGASGNMGSFIPPFGDAIAQQFKVPVGFLACGIGATSVREWLPAGTKFPNPPVLVDRVRQLPDGEWESKGEAFQMFVSRMKKLGLQGFRAVLWHQGESDANQREPGCTLPGYFYWQYMEQLIKETRRQTEWDIPWFVAQATYHVPGDEASPDIRAAQKALWESGIALEGPDSDALKGDLRENNGQGVHFSGIGLVQHAAHWVEKVAPWLDRQISVSLFNKVLPLNGEVFSVNGHEAFVILPENISGPVPWVWYAPTLPGLPANEERWMFEKFTKAGIAIAGVDAGESYGSPDGRRLFTALYKDMTEKYGFSSRPVMLGRSRGGLMTLSWAEENPDKTGGIAGIYPVCNITSYPGVEKASSAYNMTPEELSEQLGEHNPVNRLEPLARAGIPLFAIHGDKDVLVPLEKNSGEMKKRYDVLNGRMQLIIPPGKGHNMWEGFFKSSELVDFVIRNANQIQ
jgi:hypothetical protein